MPKRARHLDLNFVRALNPEGEDLLAEPPSERNNREISFEMNPAEAVRAERDEARWASLKAIGEFVLEYPRERYGAGGAPVDVGQALGLSEALLQAVALLLKKDPERLRRTLEGVVYGDLSEAALADARHTLGILNRNTLAELLEGLEPGLVGGAPADLPAQEGATRQITVDEREAHASAAEVNHERVFEALAKGVGTGQQAMRKSRRGR